MGVTAVRGAGFTLGALALAGGLVLGRAAALVGTAGGAEGGTDLVAGFGDFSCVPEAVRTGFDEVEVAVFCEVDCVAKERTFVKG